MSGSCWIHERKWTNTQGVHTRYDVQYRVGGRHHKKIHAGTFTNKKHAKDRMHLVQGYLARGLDPRAEIRKSEGIILPTVDDLWDKWVTSLRDVGERRKAVIGDARKYISPILGHLAPVDVCVEDGLRLVAKLEANKLAPGSIHLYFNVARMFMDAHTETNVLRSKLIRLPRDVKDEVQAMGYDEFIAMRAAMADTTRAVSLAHKAACSSRNGNRCDCDPVTRHRGQAPTAGPALLLALDFIEATALRLGDAKRLVRGDVSFYEGKVLVSKARGKSSKSRWVPVPRPILDELEAREQGRDDLLLPELGKHDLQKVMERACKKAGVRHFHPHDLRHRRSSLWVYQGVPWPVLQERVGHSSLETTLNVYSHVVPDPRDRWTADDYVGGVR